MKFFCQVGNYPGKEAEVVAKLKHLARQIIFAMEKLVWATKMHINAFNVNAGFLKGDRLACNGFSGTFGSASPDKLALVESDPAFWRKILLSNLIPPQQYGQTTEPLRRLNGYLLTVGDFVMHRADPDGALFQRKQHAGLFGTVLEV